MYKLVRRPPCWKSTARLARHARLDLLDKVERVESSRAKWNLGLCSLRSTVTWIVYSIIDYSLYPIAYIVLDLRLVIVSFVNFNLLAIEPLGANLRLRHYEMN